VPRDLPPIDYAPPVPARLTPPARRSDPVLRTRLLQRIGAVTAGGLVVVQAPAGYGKSTLLGQVAAAAGCPVAWLALDERDDDPAVLVKDLLAALARAGVARHDASTAPNAGPSRHAALAVPRIVEQLAAHGGPLLVVLDDVHHLQGPASLDVLRALCDQLPPACRVIVAGRTRPGIPLARLRAAGRLWEIGPGELRMTTAEGAAMLRAAGATVDDAEAALVVQRTEGWPAAIYLAAIMLRSPQAVSVEEVAGPSDADVAEYFREEVLAGADPQDAGFLVRTAILDELRPAACDHVLGRSDSAERLRALAGADLFVARVEGPVPAYRVHGLFRDMLLAELRAGDPEAEAELHARAAAACEAGGDVERAVRHALDAGDPSRAAALIWTAGPERLGHGHACTLLRWTDGFSDEELARQPEAALARGWAAMSEGDGDTAAHCSAMALGAAGQDRVIAHDATVRSMGLLLRAGIGLGGLRQLAADTTEALDGLGPDATLRSLADFFLGSIAFLEGDAPRARELLAAAEQHAAGRVPTLYTLALGQQIALAIDAGAWEEAEALASRTGHFLRSAGIEGYATHAMPLSAQAAVLAERGSRDRAREVAELAARDLALFGHLAPWIALEARLLLTRAFLRTGEGARARTFLREARELLPRADAPVFRTWLDELTGLLDRLGVDDGAAVSLTTAELRTLQYLPTHLSLREIGDRLYITRNTVKTHTIAIYRKLGVTSRSDAVATGRERGLLDG
jgi:LuxR family maltose regulon positive regulatory protein